jgi:hypothetical protein
MNFKKNNNEIIILMKEIHCKNTVQSTIFDSTLFSTGVYTVEHSACHKGMVSLYGAWVKLSQWLPLREIMNYKKSTIIYCIPLRLAE